MENMLLSRLEILRVKMNEIAYHKGLEHPDVLKISQEIDQLHNKINELRIKYQMKEKIKIIIREASVKRTAYIYARACV